MKYQIIGQQKTVRETKRGTRYKTICIIPVSNDDQWDGINAEKLTLWESTLENISMETYNGKWYDSADQNNYYIDIDYNNRGYIVYARVYNG